MIDSQQGGYIVNIPQHNKGHTGQTHSQHHIQWWKAEIISSKMRNKTKMSTLGTFIQHSIASCNHSNQTGKQDKRHPNLKGRSKTVTICKWHDTM